MLVLDMTYDIRRIVADIISRVWPAWEQKNAGDASAHIHRQSGPYS